MGVLNEALNLIGIERYRRFRLRVGVDAFSPEDAKRKVKSAMKAEGLHRGPIGLGGWRTVTTQYYVYQVKDLAFDVKLDPHPRYTVDVRTL